ncbi:hypothetical protein M885DRAFT_535804 [Pelagophyceae sp. CCMP2097]|nr:hypothetical protein M885DRAFT_535804 [Pelagophyceae sp. CCMP2097]
MIWGLLCAAVLASSAAKPAIFARQADGLKLYDFECAESQKHACACQLQCTDAKVCRGAVDVCDKIPECAYVVMNNGGDWATLKRTATAAERQELDGYAEKAWTKDDLLQNLPRLRDAGEARVRNWTVNSGSKSLVSRVSAAVSASAAGPLCGGDALGAGEILQTHLATAGRDRPVLGVVALSYKTPATLRRAVKSWADSGLLALADERLLVLNDPLPAEVAIGHEYGFDVNTPESLGIAYKRHRRPPFLPGDVAFELKAIKPNVVTIGTAFALAMALSKAQFVIFLEKDFSVDAAISFQSLQDELVTSLLALQRGASMVRLRSISDQGCGTFRRCENDANMPDWRAETTFRRRRNWWSFYCPAFRRNGAVDDCAALGGDEAALRCFTSWDSNWSLNAVILDRHAALHKKWQATTPRRPAHGGAATGRFANGATLAEYGAEKWDTQDGFEVGLLKDDWGRLRMPICLSRRGVFTHVELDG